MIDTLQKAHNEMKKLFANGNSQAVTQMLIDCQKCALQLGTVVEHLVGEDSKIISLLEGYCESLYQLSISLGKASDVRNFISNFNKQINEIKNKISDLTIDKIEVVFLPYKASMWDSMESVWIAARDDPQCDAYVIPIPYFDLISSGSKMHYEGDLYPEYVPITNWEKYDIKSHHPDIIFVHNPYDGVNNVTSVHPDFYCKQLKNYTDMLVYIPYFVSLYDVQKEFCISPGTLYADKVIVQSKKIRDTYIKEFQIFEAEHNLKGTLGKAEDKFIALGSPKFDKVIYTKKEDCTTPEEWLKLILKPDGTRRKIILYNTTVSTILQYNEAFLLKLRLVFSVLKDREDVVLWWRPHPLSLSTMESMRPQLVKEYLEIVAAYRRQTWGIYDETSELHRSIAYADFLLTDPSSVAPLFQLTGKPLLYQNIRLASERNIQEQALTFIDVYDDGIYLWFSSWTFNGLFRINKETWATEHMGIFPNEPADGMALYRSISNVNGKLYFPPLCASEMAIYDLKKKSFSKIDLKMDCDFVGSIQCDQYLYFIPENGESILRYNTIAETAEQISEWVQPLKRLWKHSTAIGFGNSTKINNLIVMPALGAPAVVILDMLTSKTEVVSVGRKSGGYSGVCYDGENCWLAPRDIDGIVKLNLITKQFREFENPFQNFEQNEDFYYASSLYLNGFVWLFPYFGKSAIKIDVNTEVISVAKEFQEESDLSYAPSESRFNNCYWSSQVIDGTIYTHTGKSNKFISYNPNNCFKRAEHIVLDNNQVAELRNALSEEPNSVLFSKQHKQVSPEETFAIGLEYYLNHLNHLNDYTNEAQLTKSCGGYAGNNIYKYVKKQILD